MSRSWGWVTVACDEPGCGIEVEVEGDGTEDEQLSDLNWTDRDGDDICPAHEEDDE